MRVAESGQHAAAVEVDPLVADRVRVALPNVDAARDHAICHGQRAHLRQARVHRVDRAVVEDQAAGSLRGVIPQQEIERRLSRLRSELRENGLDGAVIVQSTDLAYLSGTNQQAHLIVPVEGDPVLLVRRTLRRARDESPLGDVRELGSLSALAGELAGCGLGAGARIGLELDVLPAARYLSYVSRLEGLRLGDCSPALRRTRALKSEWELERMRIAAEQVRVAAEAVPGLIGPGRGASLRFNLRLRECCDGPGIRGSSGSAASTRRCTTGRCWAGRAAPCPATPTRRCAGRARTPSSARDPTTMCWRRAIR